MELRQGVQKHHYRGSLTAHRMELGIWTGRGDWEGEGMLVGSGGGVDGSCWKKVCGVVGDAYVLVICFALVLRGYE